MRQSSWPNQGDNDAPCPATRPRLKETQVKQMETPWIEYDGGAPNIDLKDRVPIKDLLADHRKQWTLKTHLGTLILKRLTRVSMEQVAIRLAQKNEEYMKLGEAKAPLWEKIQAGGELTPEEFQEAADIASKMAPFIMEFSLPCFVEPTLNNIEEYDALISHLHPDEQTALKNLIAELVKPGDVKSVGNGALTIAKEFNVPLASDLTMENMTAKQYAALQGTLEEQARQVEQELKKVAKPQ